ncbi:E3 ubiquitin-protein ligase WAV3 isoform X3 [Medicago truncatula]|uniref:Zinc finger, C3HC4 type (RING finger) protein n=2 Tax=Medicago truncatula TaxID=3880 RepID=A0A072VCQ9_MEDTR|nr:E3 ubiquitin-protein ligase WAV3 isoform X3 [Medicago truncatula]XP_039686770.1 E3 ubiquitin-protein ligase WAV3 isoform X3 [Medicago truncatula]KEH39351.1 zinc finger, C3HC4 type (RING finger) protein [Medicago truncatula]
MKPGQGQAIFTAECSHSFHFQCITSNVRYGNQICPVCRAKWKEVPFQNTASNVSHDISQPRGDTWSGILRRLSSSRQNGTVRQGSSRLNLNHNHNITEPAIFDDDDEVLDQQTSITHHVNDVDHSIENRMEITTYPEVSAVSKSDSHDNFTVLVHLKAPPYSIKQNGGRSSVEPSVETSPSRARVDLVTVLDVSGSMTGSKITLLKQAMSFVIQNLSSSDRLSIIVFSSTARRIFPLRRMNDDGRQQALRAVNALVPNGGTDIAEGLKKGVKVFVDRRWKNPVGGIMLLTDGQDTHNICTTAGIGEGYQSLVPNSIHRNNGEGLKIPVHAFGFGVDHDATLMHSISEISGGTFSFIEAEEVIQDAFAQCIGGLLSVVVQDLHVEVRCAQSRLQLSSVKAGSYQSTLTNNARMASIKAGDLYAEEERDFLVTLNVPVEKSSDEMSLLIITCIYSDPITKMEGLDVTSEVKIQRPNVARDQVVSIEVDRQRNRLQATEAMAEARVEAERGDLTAAISVLERCQRALSETISAQAGDPLCTSLSAELKEMQDRMATRRVYEESGRAYVLSGMSSHLGQRATARGDSTDSTSFVRAYQTPSMADMVSRSQTILVRTPQSSGNILRPTKSFSGRQQRK